METTITAKRELPKFLHELNAIVTLVFREIKTTVKAPEKLFMAMIFPVMFLGLFGSQLSQNMGFMMEYDFSSFMVIGMLVNSMFMMVSMGVHTLAEDRENDFTQEIFIAPVSRVSIMLGKVIGAGFTGYVQFFATLVVGLIMGVHLTVSQFWISLALTPLMTFAAGSIGVLILGLIRSASAAEMAIMMFAMIQTFVSGAIIPINNSTGVMGVVNHIVPMTYAVDLARGLCGFGETTMYAPWVDLCVIVGYTIVFFILGTWLFIRGEKNK